MAERTGYNLGAVRALIQAAFDDEGLSTLCFDHFWPVYKQFAAGQEQGARVRRLVEYAWRQGRVEELLARVAAANPAQYAAFEERLRAPAETGPAPPTPADYLGDLPPGSYLPHRSNPDFVGREEELAELARLLAPQGGATVIGQVAAATGMGGIGKSQLAVEYAYRHGRDYPGGVFWLACERPETLPAQVAAMGGRDENGGLDLAPNWYELDQAEQIRRVRHAWLAETPRLLIFDNAEDAAVLEEWRPPRGGCRLLITSRRQAWPGEVARLPLATLPRPDRLRLLLGFRAGELRQPVEAVIAAHRAAADLPADIPARRPADALARLADLGLLELASPERAPRLHRLLAEFARHKTLAGERAALADAVAGAIEDRVHEVVDAGLPAALTPALREHLQAALAAAEARGSARTGGLYNALGRTLDQLGADYAGARAAFERALAIDEAVYGPDHPKVAIQVNNLGGVLRALGDLAGARAAFERALAIDEAVYGPDHPAVARDVNNLGGVLRALGDLAGALAICERVYGPDHPRTRLVRGNLEGLGREGGQGDIWTIRNVDFKQ